VEELMSAPTQLNILLLDGSTTVTVAIPSALVTAQPGTEPAGHGAGHHF
jgi:hypothetical protein